MQILARQIDAALLFRALLAIFLRLLVSALVLLSALAPLRCHVNFRKILVNLVGKEPV
jgi:hypothetical protein